MTLDNRKHLTAGAAAIVAIALFAAPVRAEDTCGGGLTDIVDFSKAPSDVEGQNKVRVSLQPHKDDKTGALTIEVQGSAYYPDGVTLMLGLRHWKVKECFAKSKVTVKDRIFTAKFGPFTKAIPAGGLTVEAWFVLAAQTDETKVKLVKEKYFHCVPPCRRDERNLTQVTFSLGGTDLEAQAEKQEKEQIGATRKAILDAQKVAEGIIAKVEQHQAPPTDAEKALTRLEADLKAALDEFTKWYKARQFPLFAGEGNKLRALSTHIRDAARAHAVVAGATIPGFPAGQAQSTLQTATAEAQKVADELKGFIEESDSLDKTWEKTGNDITPAPETGKAPEGGKPDAKTPGGK